MDPRSTVMGWLMLCGGILLGARLCGAAEPAPEPPLNILLITADDLGLQLGCYGDEEIATPHLDALARSGRTYDAAYVAQASCSPSRSALFTGLFPHANGQYGLLNADVGFALHRRLQDQTIPNLLKRAGYRTGILGKLHVGPESSFKFDTRIRLQTRDVRQAAQRAGEFLADVPDDQPFFFMANYSDPHVYGRSPRPPKEAFPTQFQGIPEQPLEVGEVSPLPFQRLDDPEQIERTTQYYNAVMRLDAGVGMLLEALDATGRRDRTLVIFVSDHGPPFFRGKTSCYEAGVRVPLIVQWPSVFEAGDRSTALVSTVDLLPTILQAAGQPVPDRLHGISLKASRQPANQREYVATEFHYHGARPFYPRRAIRDQRYKLIHNLRAGETEPHRRVDGDVAYEISQQAKFSGTAVARAMKRAADPPEYELYDLHNDPWEFENLANHPEHRDTLERLKEALMKWRQRTGDPLLSQEGYRQVAAYAEKKKQAK